MIRVLDCSVPGCPSAWFEPTTWDSVRGQEVLKDHGRAIRSARKRGWTGDGSTGCLCANRDIRCPEHRVSEGTGDENPYRADRVAEPQHEAATSGKESEEA